MELFLPDEVKLIFDLLNSKGYEAFVVGGCVRDMLLGKKPKDWDLATNAKPQAIEDVFVEGGFKVIPTGIKHGTLTVLISNIPFEVTTYRVDGRYSDSRRPDEVTFTASIYEDLSRRDFTMNAMAYNNRSGLIDPFGGLNDTNSKTITCVGNPNDRFDEDALRMLRAVRLSAQLNFEIASHVKIAIQDKSCLINRISKERIREEFEKILLSDPEKINLLSEMGLLSHIMAEFQDCMHVDQQNPYHIYDVAQHSLKAASSIEENLTLRLTMLLHDVGKPLSKTLDEKGIGHFYGHAKISAAMSDGILKNLRYDNLTIDEVKTLIYYHDHEIHDSEKSVRRWIARIGEDLFIKILKVKEADANAQNPIYYQDRSDRLQRIKTILEEVLKRGDCLKMGKLAINGSDLIKLGFHEGKEIGRVLNELLEKVLEEPEKNTKEKLISLAMESLK